MPARVVTWPQHSILLTPARFRYRSAKGPIFSLFPGGLPTTREIAITVPLLGSLLGVAKLSEVSPEPATLLVPAKIVETIARLRERVASRFPDSSLLEVCKHLLDLGQRAEKQAPSFGQPYLILRALAFLLSVALIICISLTLYFVKLPDKPIEFVEFLQGLDAGANQVVLFGAAIFFLLTIERRWKRNRALKVVNQLRSIAHVIDMHQLTKDPERLVPKELALPSSPKREMSEFNLSRYLDYSCEMLSLVGKIAVVYVQHFDDPVAIASANEVEDLCTSLSRKIWQKIMLIHSSPTAPPVPKIIT